jgi:hypothetical protein
MAMNNLHPDIDSVVNNRTITAYLGLELKTLCRSPLPGRTDSTPSFSIFIGSNGRQVWKDHGISGTGSCGNIITLHRILRGCNTDSACRELLEWDGVSVMHQVSTVCVKTGRAHNHRNTCNDNMGVRTNKPVELSRYICETELPVPEWVKEQLELYVDAVGNLCIPTTNGIHLKGSIRTSTNKTFAGNIGAAGFTVCGNAEGDSWMVIEGIGDFLAFIDTVPGLHTTTNYIILNSTQTIPHAIEWLHTQNVNELFLLLDNDIEGTRGTNRFIEAFENATDQRSVITYGKDFKDTWKWERSKR